ncbi:MAG: TPM domain-containing protein [Steroidobacteraceae bacterium]
MRTLARLLRHLCTTTLGTRRLFSPAVLSQIEAAIGVAEAQHSGEIRFVVETALPEWAVWQGLTPRQRAVQVFAHLRVWDTHHNNGVLIYVLRADRAVEILADRGISSKVSEREWQAVCRQVEGDYRAGRYAEGSSAAVAGVARLLGEHFPPGGSGSNELPNQPILL